ncbi:acidic leucine-rich nuclear phospho 32-related [Olea europaea subsp. europaea]|uniref:Acidic leucine-rich nuclear phospho 32-related n=1 Tax=Olea europaea subsp. europaea TaxID=158383 RepID=A0A8S0RDP0_OLEEU|nr:acidic leucine-rich nuclear phospho 32-related [Olea europaea subsp. europaea]
MQRDCQHLAASGGLKFLVEAGLESLRDLDLSNNRISDINDLRPLAELRLVSLDLYECPVTRVKDYRSRVFGLIKSLKYLDKTDAEGNERPESDDDDEEEEDDDDEEDDDPGSGEIDGGEDRPLRLNNGNRAGSEGVVDVDEDEESDADEEEAETSRGVNGISSGGSFHHQSNGFRVEAVNAEDDEDSVEEVYEDEGDDDEDVVEVHEIDDSDDDDGVDDDEEDDDEEVDNDEGDLGEPVSTQKFTSTEGEIDGHEQGEDDVDEDDNGETGEEDEEGVEEDGDFEDDEEAEDEEDNNGTGYLVQPVGQVEADAGGGDLDPVNEGEEPELEEDEDEDGEVQELPPAAAHKRKRDDEDGDGDEEEEDVDAHHTTGAGYRSDARRVAGAAVEATMGVATGAITTADGHLEWRGEGKVV